MRRARPTAPAPPPLQADQAQLEQLWTLLDSYPDPTGMVLAALEDAQAGVHVQLHGYDAASGTLTFSAVLPQVVDIPAYVRRLEGSALFAQVAYGGYEDGGGRLHAAAGLCAGRPGKRGAKEAAAMRLETACDRTGTKSCCTARGSRPPCCCTASLRCRPRCRPTPRRRANGGRRRTAAGQMQAAAGEAAARESERKKRPPRSGAGGGRRTHTPCFPARNWTPLVTGLALDSGLQPLALTIGAATAPDLQGYALSADGDGTLPPAGTGGLQAVALQGTAQGTYAAFAALLDDLAANYPALQLRSFTVSESAWLTAAGGAETQVEFRYELTAYMYDTEGLAE